MRIKTVRSHLSVADLAQLAARGGHAAGPAPLPAGDASAFEVDRVVNNSGLVNLGGRLDAVPEADFDRIMAVNVKGTWLCVREEVRVMER